MYKKIFGIISALALSIALTACGGGNEDADNEETPIGEEVDYTIVGIDPGSGIMDQADNALSEYDLEGWEVQESSGAAMTAELKSSIDQEEPVIVTGWIPHWKFIEFDLKMLDDPKKVFGEEQ